MGMASLKIDRNVALDSEIKMTPWSCKTVRATSDNKNKQKAKGKPQIYI
jgi:hypothetical protein